MTRGAPLRKPKDPPALQDGSLDAAGLRWHVRRWPADAPSAPVALLLHGTGASVHSWEGLAPRLAAAGLHVVAPDLPGHGDTRAPRDARAYTLPGMARAVAMLAGALGRPPDLLVGHSAGAAVALQAVLDGLLAPRAVVSINGALCPWHGLAGVVFPPMARTLAAIPFVPALFAWRARDPAAVRRLIDGTGSRLDDAAVEAYGRLVRDPAHAAAALAMMARWDLRPLERALPRLPVPLTLLVGERDRAVPAWQARAVHARVPGATLEAWAGLGHLAHEEAPALAARAIVQAAVRAGLVTAPG